MPVAGHEFTVSERELSVHHRYRVLAVTWPCVAIIAVLLFISAVNILAMSATRAYVTGNALWARAERETSSLLIRYAHSGDPQLLAEADAQMSVVLGDRSARLELLKDRPDYASARRGLVAGGNNPGDVASMIALLRQSRALRIADEPLRIWRDADELFLRYQDLRREDIALRRGAEPGITQLDDWGQRVHRIHEPLLQLEQQFSHLMDDYARNLATFLLVFLGGSAAVLLAAGYVVSRRLIGRSSAMAVALQASQNQVFAEQQRAHVLLGSISDAVISTNREGRIEFLNTAAETLTGWTAAEAHGQDLQSVFRVVAADNTDKLAIGEAIAAVLCQGEVRRLSSYGAQLLRRDQSITPIGERAAPLHDRAGEVVGMVLVMRDVTAERQQWDQLRHQAAHDALTGLPNRAHFESQLKLLMQKADGTGSRYTVMFIDLDEFKAVNDTGGHRAGDELLRGVGPCIQEQMRAGDLLARLGGDEFGLLLPACDVNTALQIAQRVCRAVQGLKFAWSEMSFTVTASIGVVLDEPALSSVADVLNAADRACYAAKKTGRNGVCVYRATEESKRWRVIDTKDVSA